MPDQHDINDQFFTLIQNLLERFSIRLNTKQIAEKFGVSEHTAYRCLEEISLNERFPIWEEKAQWVFGLKPLKQLSTSNDSHIIKTEQTNTIKVFYCYAHKDKILRDKIAAHLSPLRRKGDFIEWSDHDILPGTDWLQAINQNLRTANIILLLLSSNFLQSDDCYKEMKHALERQSEGKAHVIPIILSPVNWEDTPIHHLQVLPTGGLPITRWRNREEAFQKVANDVAIVAQTLLTQLRNKKRVRNGYSKVISTVLLTNMKKLLLLIIMQLSLTLQMLLSIITRVGSTTGWRNTRKRYLLVIKQSI